MTGRASHVRRRVARARLGVDIQVALIEDQKKCIHQRVTRVKCTYQEIGRGLDCAAFGHDSG